jgi:hypothetical protein
MEAPIDLPFSAPAPPMSRLTPTELWEAVLRARIALANERHLVRHNDGTARAVLLGALESYVTSLNERGHPVPYALRDELRLNQRTCGRVVIRSID